MMLTWRRAIGGIFDNPKKRGIITTMKNPVGRPRTTTSDLPSDWREIMTDLGERGRSAAEARIALGIGISAWQTLLKDSAEFREAEASRKSLSEIWWVNRGQEMSCGSDGNAAVWIFNMKNRFGWRDRQDHNHMSEDGSMSPSKMTDEDLDRRLAELESRLSK